MTVGELIEELKKFDPNMEVVLQKDPEGNGYEYLSGADPQGIVIEEEFNIDVYDGNWTAEEAGMDEEDWQHYLTLPRSVILYP